MLGLGTISTILIAWFQVYKQLCLIWPKKEFTRMILSSSKFLQKVWNLESMPKSLSQHWSGVEATAVTALLTGYWVAGPPTAATTNPGQGSAVNLSLCTSRLAVTTLLPEEILKQFLLLCVTGFGFKVQGACFWLVQPRSHGHILAASEAGKASIWHFQFCCRTGALSSTRTHKLGNSPK